MSDDGPGIETPERREKLDRLSRQLRIDQTARALYVEKLNRYHADAADKLARNAYAQAEYLEAERERRQKDTESS